MSPHLIDTLTALLRPFARTAALAVALLAGACGGVGEEGTGIRTESANVGVVSGVSDTSVTVNGVDYRREKASLSDGVGQPLSGDDLLIGMWVEVSGTSAGDGTDAVADTIRVRPAARGEIKSVAPDGTVTLLDSPVTLGAGTVVDTGSDASALAPGNLVEVHGPLGAASGAVVASRLERLATTPTVAVRYELRGRVSQLRTDLKTLTVGGRQVDYGSATVLVGTGLRDGQVVRVSSAVAPVDGVPWPVDDLRSDAELPANLGFLYTEGFVELWQAGPAFQIDDLEVDASTANGRAQVTANGQRVALFGPRVNGTLKARGVRVIQPGAPVVFTLFGPVSNYTSIASFRVRGVPIDATDLAASNPAAVPTLADGVRVRVDGTVRGRGLSATKITLLP